MTLDENWLEHAKNITEYARTHFANPSSNLFYYTSDIDPPLITRKIETADDVIPGSNSVMAQNLHLLGLYYYNTEWVEISQKMMQTMADQIIESGSPDFYSNWCQGLYVDHAYQPYEVAVVGSEANDKIKGLNSYYLPNAIMLGGEDEGSLELLEGKLQEGETMIYVCRNKVCKLPVTEIEKALELIK